MHHNTSMQIQLFDRKFVANILRNFRRCPKCHNEYSYNYDKKVGDTHVKSNRPFLLPCGHNMCENCVFHYRQNLCCSVCLRPIEITMTTNQHQQTGFFVRDFFDMNFYLMGEINHLRYYRRDGSALTAGNVATTGTIGQFHNLNATRSPLDERKCSECETVSACGHCRQCKVYYCKPCYHKIHMNSKVLKTHSLTPLDKDHMGNKGMKMPKVTYCRRHHKVNDRYCRKCRLICCSHCARADHQTHGWTKLIQENECMSEDIVHVVDAVKLSRESLRKAQKDVKAVENQLEEYATQTIEEISNYFVLLHGFLQNEQRRILNEFNKMCLYPQVKLREVSHKLNDSQNRLNIIRTNLDVYQHQLPTDIHMRDVINFINAELENLQCQVDISKVTSNPFKFEVKHDLRKDFATKHYSYTYTDPKINVLIGPLYGDLNRSFLNASPTLSQMDLDASFNSLSLNMNDASQKMLAALQVYEKGKEPLIVHSMCSTQHSILQAKHKANTQTALTETASNSMDNKLVHISHVNSPEHFYVQLESSLEQIRELSNKYINYMHQEVVPKVINEGKCYMTYHTGDKQWYRGVVKEILPNDLYEMFLVDIGLKIEVTKLRLGDIDESYLKIPYAAIRCAIHDIMPTDSSWTDEANKLLIEITHNKHVRLSIIDCIEGSFYKVDLFTTHTAEPISVRDAFLYTGLARERSGTAKNKLQHKKISSVARISERFLKHILQPGEMLTVKILHIDDPQQFYILRLDQVDVKKQMCAELNHYYEEHSASKEPLFVASLQMCCVVCIRGVWHRASVKDITEHGNIYVHLVDEGLQELVHWRKIYFLETKFQSHKEFAIKCSLADLQPLQENGYAWSEKAINEFKQLSSNPTLQMNICLAKAGEYKVALHVSKKNSDINIGAMLVKNGHAVSTGEATQISELFKRPKRRLDLPNSVFENAAKQTAANSKSVAVKVLKRTLIRVTFIVSPGEFYIQLHNLIPGILKFQEQIQEVQRQKLGTRTSISKEQTQQWSVGQHCLVYTKYQSTTTAAAALADNDGVMTKSGECEWYRGVIISIKHNETESKEADQPKQQTYVVFLRDIGATVHSIKRSHLCAIEQEWDRVCNAVYRCHLACVEPTGGVAKWSHSSIDYFKHSLNSFQSLSATLQGKRDQNSIPIVLWGTITEPADPLAPCISKHSNINRILVKAGLAHLVERLDITQQIDKLIQMELTEGEITLEEWFKNFSKNTVIKECSPDESLPIEIAASDDLHHIDNFSYELDPIDLDFDTMTDASTPSPEAWLRSKVLDKSLFTAYPTYVDYNCVIYLHDADDHSLLAEMRSKIMLACKQRKTKVQLPQTYAPGQACLVMYHIDRHYYRGIVQKLNKNNEYVVKFIDYGNKESVKLCDLLPYAPYRNLPALACMYTIEGICPKNENAKHASAVLDIIHKTIVDKLISVRVPTEEIGKPVKLCSIRIGSMDVAKYLISEGLVNSRKDNYSPGMPRRQLTIAPIEEDPLRAAMEIDLDQSKTTPYRDLLDVNILNIDDDDDDDDVDEVNDEQNPRIDEVLSRLEKDEDFTLDPPMPKRMFDANDYQKLHAQMQYGGLYGAGSNMDDVIGCADNAADDTMLDFVVDHLDEGVNALDIDDSDQDIVELEQSFEVNYWQKLSYSRAMKDDALKFDEHRRPSSEFELFSPNDTSTVFSNYSGMQKFKCPQLPTGIRSFECSVVNIITPMVLQIFPHLTEIEFRDMELQRRIKHLVHSTPALAQYEPHTICLACYSKDKRWYRALIRSYNPSAKTVDVLYVDYLNIETLSIKYLKECPKELMGWPLRTFSVRLHGVKPNPRMRIRDIRQALGNVLRGRILYARINKRNIENKTEDLDEATASDKATDDKSENTPPLLEITLYASRNDANLCPVYESLIQDNFYYRI